MARDMTIGSGGQGWRIAGWGLAGLALAVLLGGAGLAIEAVVRQSENRAYRAAIVVALLGCAALVVINGAVGIIGSEQDDANLAFGGVLAVGLIGTLVARARAVGMRRVMVAMAVAQVLAPVSVYAAMPDARRGLVTPELGALTLGFVAVWLASAWLFRKAA